MEFTNTAILTQLQYHKQLLKFSAEVYLAKKKYSHKIILFYFSLKYASKPTFDNFRAFTINFLLMFSSEESCQFLEEKGYF